jgi:hypothetical protein
VQDLRNKDNYKIDPDPVSIGLAILGALGSFASIASYLEGKKHQQERFRPLYDMGMPGIPIGRKSVSFKTKFRDRVTKLDASLEDLKGRLETLISLLEDVEYIDGTQLSELPFEFGAIQPLLEKQDLALFFRIQNEVNYTCTKITKECQGLIKILDDLERDISPEIYSKTLQLRSMINKPLGQKLKFKDVFDINLKSIEASITICEMLKNDFEAWYK